MSDAADPPFSAELGPADRALLRRIMTQVESLPLRYAPFYARLSELFDLSEHEVLALLTRARDESAWKKTLIPGVRRLVVQAGPRLKGAEVQVMRLAPGLRFPRHRHRGEETLFVLEGAYVDERDGTRVGPGERQDLAFGTEHALLVEECGPCVAAVISRGADFTGPVLGRLHRWLAWFRR